MKWTKPAIFVIGCTFSEIFIRATGRKVKEAALFGRPLLWIQFS
jgi:hypothetical protein